MFKPVAMALMSLVFLTGCETTNRKLSGVVIEKNLTLNANLGEVWAALTDANELDQWWNKGVRLEAKVGGEFYEPWGDGQLATGKVLSLKEKDYIEFTWKEKSWTGPEVTVCKFTILELNGQTYLKMQHSGWETFKDPEVRAKTVEGFKKGWDFFLGKLVKHIEGAPAI